MKIIYGPKGTGKTKAIIDSANQALDQAKGHVIFITDTGKYSHELNIKIRFLDVSSFEIQNADGLRGFIKGIVAANGDNEYIFIDGLARIAGKKISELQDVYVAMEKLEKDFGVKFTLTCSATKEELPEFILKYVD
jgi:predicted AAA+ superfamily ATPase